MGKYIVGIDLGGTKIATALTDLEGRILARTEIPTEAAAGVEAVLERMAGTVRQVLAAGGVAPGELMGIGIGSPGPLNSRTGVIIHAPNLGWRNVPLRDRFMEIFPTPVWVDNDANLAGLGEAYLGAGRGKQDLLYMTVSTGIGGGIILGGRIHHGAHDTAGEIGHIIVEKDGPLCNCGMRGCLEALASGPALARRAREGLAAGRASQLKELVGGNLEAITPREIAQAAAAGDTFAQELLRETGVYLGLGIASLLNVLDPEMVVIGGGVAQIGDPLFIPVRETVKNCLGAVPVAAIPIVPAVLGGDVGVLGAVMLVRAQIQG